jgi:hypothetical protein
MASLSEARAAPQTANINEDSMFGVQTAFNDTSNKASNMKMKPPT